MSGFENINMDAIMVMLASIFAILLGMMETFFDLVLAIIRDNIILIGVFVLLIGVIMFMRGVFSA